jgi:hypothetical protein
MPSPLPGQVSTSRLANSGAGAAAAAPPASLHAATEEIDLPGGPSGFRSIAWPMIGVLVLVIVWPQLVLFIPSLISPEFLK